MQYWQNWQQGDKLNDGKYIVEQLLGGGGYGVTYKVRETRTKKLFAIKTLNYQRQQQGNFERLQEKFVNETIALASCRYPNIVRVYPKMFQEEGLWCMVMEYVEGKDLAEYLDTKGRFDEQEAIDIISKVGNALSYVHQQGFLHRDIKPGNILLRKSDLSPVLIDFGLAREYTPGSLRSMTDAKTECYAPIEQYQRHGNFGAWTDVYALAATLYVLVTKQLPLPAQFRAYAPLPPPKQHNPDLSDRINAAILKGMELEPENRPQSVAEWLELLKPKQKMVDLGGSSFSLQVFEFETVQIKEIKASSRFLGLGEKKEVILSRYRNQVKYFSENLGNDITLEMVEIPSGTFMMGSPESEKGRYDWESPQHQVTVPPFFMGKFEVTQAQWKAVASLPQVERELKPDPSRFKGDKLPVEQVSWYDAVEFCRRLSNYTGKEYRLPSEAEWEYACRAGTTTPFHFGKTITTDLANYRGTDWEYQNKIYPGNYANEAKGEYREKTTPVGSFLPNAFGLYDMHGNVWEWCEDDWHDSYDGAPTDGSRSKELLD